MYIVSTHFIFTISLELINKKICKIERYHKMLCILNAFSVNGTYTTADLNILGMHYNGMR